MAVMEIDEVVSNTGFKKTIDEESAEVILNMVQVGIYQFPFKSMVRETVSNAVDAVKEKEIARLILTGAAQVSDFYVDLEGDRYKSSRFDPDYYDLAWLSPKDTVEIEYIVNSDPAGRDTFSVKDYGVGLGKTRLEKFFLPGASSKRLNKQALGKFGIGNKSPLATGAGSYYLTSTYNGHLYKFEIRETKIDSIIPKFNIKGEMNPHVVLENTLDMNGNPMIVYYEPTTEKNSVKIEVDIKKHNKNQIMDAVSSQLMYFKEDIEFTETKHSVLNEIDFKSPILFEDEDVILPVTTGFFAKPHFVLNGVCYGLIDFNEMELNPRFGCIGIKVDISSVDVTPSRESVMYSEKTKKTILSQYDKISKKVQTLVEKELTERDPIKWLSMSSGIISNSANSSNPAISRLASLIDVNDVNLKYSSDIVDLNLNQSLNKTFTPFLSFSMIAKEGYGSNQKVKLNSQTVLNFSFENMYYKDCKSDPIVNKFLYESNPSKSIGVYEFTNMKETEREFCKTFIAGKITKDELKVRLATPKPGEEGRKEEVVEEIIKAASIIKLLSTSKSFKRYSEVIVPEDFKSVLKAEEADSTAYDPEKEAAIRAAKRKAMGLIVVSKPWKNNSSNYVFSSTEMAVADIPDNVVYGHNADSEALMSVAKLSYYNLTDNSAIYSNTDLSNTKDEHFFKVSMSVKNKFKEHTHVTEWGFSIIDDKLEFHEALKPYISYLYISRLFPKKDKKRHVSDQILRMGEIAATIRRIDDRYFKLYKEMFHDKSFDVSSMGSLKVLKLITFCVDLAIFKRQNPHMDADDIEDYCRDNFPNMDLTFKDIKDYKVFQDEDLNTLDQLLELTDVYYEPFSELINISTGSDGTLHGASEAMVKKYGSIILDSRRSLLSDNFSNLF